MTTKDQKNSATRRTFLKNTALGAIAAPAVIRSGGALAATGVKN